MIGSAVGKEGEIIIYRIVKKIHKYYFISEPIRFNKNLSLGAGK